MTTNVLKFAAMLLVFAGSFTSCKDKEKCEPFVLIGKSSLSGCEGISQQDIVIKTQEEWEDFKTIMNTDYNQIKSSNYKETDSFSETEIDFDLYQIIAVIDEKRPDGCWGMEIKCITEDTYRIVVTIQVKSSVSKGFACVNMEHQPYHIVKIPVSTKKIEFKHIVK